MDERGDAKSQTGREISCQPQRHRQGEESRGKSDLGKRGRGWHWRGSNRERSGWSRPWRRMAQKPQVSSRDLCEIPTMPHVKKKTALRCVPTPYSRPSPRFSLLPLPSHRCESSSGNGNGRGASFCRWKSLAFKSIFRGTVKRTAIYENWPRPARASPKWFVRTR